MNSRSMMRALVLPVAVALALVVAGPAAAGAQRDYVGLVNPWVESDLGRFFFFQSASNPFGFVKLRPDTSTQAQWSSGYMAKENEVKGFSHVHDWQLSGVQVMPTSGAPVPKTQGDTGWQSHVEHDGSEFAQAGYHRLHLDRYDIKAELTATDRVGVHRYTFGKAGPAEIIVNLGGTLGEAIMTGAHVTKASAREITGYVDEKGTLTDGQYYGQSHGQRNRLFFDIRFDRPFDSLNGWKDGKETGPVDELAGHNTGVFARYDHLDAGDVVQVKVALSLTGADGAKRNMEAEAPGWNFDAVRQASQARWNDMLGRIDVSGGRHQQQEKFYTDLFHVLCGRSMVSDADGRYLDNTWQRDRVAQIPLGRDGKPQFAMYNYDALWLTQWNVNTMLGLAYPDVYSSLVKSQLQMYKDGGLLPRGPVAGDDSFVMTSSPVTSFIAGAWNKGIRDFDIDTAYDAMLDAQSIGGLFDKAPYEYATWGGNGGAARSYLDRGYVAQDLSADWHSRGAGETLEYAFQDWTLAQLARELGKKGVNQSQYADVTVSSQADATDRSGARAVDGRPIRSGIRPKQSVEWISTERDPWIRLDWKQPHDVRKVVLSDRADPSVNARSGVLRFSDGSTKRVDGIPADGTPKVVHVGRRRADWVRFEVTGGEGSGVGLNEIEVWDDTDASRYLLDRSRNWRNLYDPSTGFIRPKNSDGSWLTPFDPLEETDFVEANSWQATWFTSHDVMGLATLMGGPKAYADKLDHAFRLSEGDGFLGGGQNGLENAYISYGNQPGLADGHLFNYVGYPWLTQHWVREVGQKVYGATSSTDGYGHHDEDQGQMGAMSALMAMGLFEVTGGGLSDPVYDITSPVFDEVRIALDRDYDRGKEFRIVTHGASAANQYIQRAELSGKPLDDAWFRHDTLARGGTLELWLGPQPNKQWGVGHLPPSETSQARTVTATGVKIDAPDTIEQPYGTVQLTAGFEPADTSYKRVDWAVTEPDGSPTDKASIDYDGALTVNHSDGDVLVSAVAADGGGAKDSKLIHIALDPQRLRGNAARWPGVTATASSEFNNDYRADLVHDGITRQWAVGEWASKGEQKPWIELHFPKPVRSDRIVIFDRSDAEDANAGTLTFGDGSSVDVTGIPAGGGPKTVEFPLKTFDTVRFQVTAGTGPNVGLSELEAYAIPSKPDAPTDAAAAAGSGTATVTWKAPAFDGGAPLTAYVVTPYRDGTAQEPVTVGADRTTAAVSGLQAGAAYAFTVTARSLMGDSPESASSGAVTP